MTMGNVREKNKSTFTCWGIDAANWKNLDGRSSNKTWLSACRSSWNENGLARVSTARNKSRTRSRFNQATRGLMRGPGGEGTQHRWGEWCARSSRLKCKREGLRKCVHAHIRRWVQVSTSKRINYRRTRTHIVRSFIRALPNIIGCITR